MFSIFSLPKQKNYIVVKVIFWTIAFLYLLDFYKWIMPTWASTIGASIVNIVAFVVISEMFIHFWAVPKYFRQAKYGIFLVAVAFCILINGIATILGTWFVIQPISPGSVNYMVGKWHGLIFSNFFVVAAFTAMSITTKLMFDWLSLQEKMEETEKKKIKAELEFLKSQINPHFLFNSLNSIYATIDRQNSKARTLLLKFSDVLRYQLYECSEDFVPIEREIEFLTSYVEVQKMRKSEKIAIELKMSGCFSGYKIAPLLFIPFAENAFKYVSSYRDRENFLRIEITQKSDTLRFKCENTIENHPAEDLAESGGIGINNVRRRLELLYPERHLLVRENSGNCFRIDLTLYL
jgi:two-component system, LytTR family, sensor kinase